MKYKNLINNNSLVNDKIRKKCVKILTDGLERIMDLETVEKWKPFPVTFLKNKYEISNKGKVRNKKKGTIRIQDTKSGYCKLNFYRNKKLYTYTIHRKVAKLFIKNNDPINNTWVNHIDGNKQNNNYKNLEWTTSPGNAQHAVDTGLQKITKCHVIQFDVDGSKIREFESQTVAAKETGIDRRLINRVCNGNRKTAGGFIWKNLNIDENKQDIDLKEYKQIKKFPNYWISEEGKIYSLYTHKFKRTKIKNNGVVYVQLTKPNPKGGQIIIEIPLRNLVAKYFLEKPQNKKFNFICHKDNDKSNNNADNLEWCYMPSVKHILMI